MVSNSVATILAILITLMLFPIRVQQVFLWILMQSINSIFSNFSEWQKNMHGKGKWAAEKKNTG